MGLSRSNFLVKDTHIVRKKEKKSKIVKNMGVIRKIVLSLLLVANLAHGQLSVDLNGGDITAPLQHQGKIQQQFSPENIDRTYGDATGQHLAPLDENIETIYVSPEEYAKYDNQASNDYGDYNPKQAAPSSSGLESLLSFNGIFHSILVLTFLTLFSQTFEKIWPLIGKKPSEEEKRMFKVIEDSAIANIMSSIEEFKTKYLN